MRCWSASRAHSNPVDLDRQILPDPWFWAKMTHADRKPLRVDLDLDDLDFESSEPVTLRIHFRALSRPKSKPEGAPDHRVEISIDGSPVGTAEWDGRTTHLWESLELPAGSLRPATLPLELEVAERIATEGRPLVDVVMLDWVEIAYPQRATIGEAQTPVTPASPGPGSIRLQAEDVHTLVAYGNSGSRTTITRQGGDDAESRWALSVDPEETSYLVVVDEQLYSPVAIELDRPSELKATGNRADYLMIAHESLLEAARPLADFHRERGLQVALIDVQDIYDEFQSRDPGSGGDPSLRRTRVWRLDTAGSALRAAGRRRQLGHPAQHRRRRELRQLVGPAARWRDAVHGQEVDRLR